MRPSKARRETNDRASGQCDDDAVTFHGDKTLMVLVAKIMDFSYSNAAEEEENIVTLCSKSLRLLLHFGEVIGFDEDFDELFSFGAGES